HLVDGATPDEGEIVLSGPQVARGYWNAPELTAEAFVEIDIEGTPTPVYRTGDWGIRENGHTYFVSRVDRQIKIRGHRVELGEIDKAARDTGLRSACTVFVDHALHCFVEGDEPVDFASVRMEMERALPPYAMPSSFQQLNSLPRNANEKIDVNVLIERVKNGS
ncbi:MAG: AMP-binding protein, partial [Rhodospirillales bacterium]|nr:AMP-binding protein [Rhodospirillales bacterium]